MRDRSLGMTSLAILAVMVGIYSFMGAIALLWGGAIASFAGAEIGALVFALGALFFGLSMAAYAVGFGLWTQKSWSWAGGVVIFSTIVILNVALSVMAANFINMVLPLVGAGAALVYLYRPSTRALLLGETPSVTVAALDLGEVAETTA